MSVVGIELGFLINGREPQGELRRITVAFERTGDDVADFSKFLFPKLGGVFEVEERRQFDSEGDGSWAALSPKYAAWKNKHYPGKPTLELTGALKAALTQSSSSFAERSYTSTEFVFGTRGLPYATTHQLGDPARNIPARPPFDFSSDFERDLDAATEQSVRDAVHASGLAEFVEGP